MELKGFKYRIYPNKEQKDFLDRSFGARRFVYNKLLGLSIWLHERHKSGRTKHEFKINKFSFCYLLKKLKNLKKYPWLKEATSQSLQVAALDLTSAYSNFFKKKSGFPNFKKKSGEQSFRIPQGFMIDLDESRVYIPKLKSGIKVVQHRRRPPKSKIKSLTFSKTPSGKYFVSMLVKGDFEEKKKTTRKNSSIGIDLGLISLIATSAGESIQAPKFLKKAERRIKLLQKRVSKKVKGSKNRAKARLRLAKAHEKVSNQRGDFLHKLSRRLVNENQVVYAEDLAVKNMVKNHSLAKSISDAGWSELLRQLDYKGKLVRIGRFSRSTGVCKDCHIVGPKLDLSVREWTCSSCGSVNDRDISAAIQIKKLGEGLAVGQELPDVKPVEKLTSARRPRVSKQAGSVKQESSSVERKAS